MPDTCQDQNLKFTPPRTRLVLKSTFEGVPVQAVPQLRLPRSTRRYSALAVQFLPSAISRPPPAVQPALVVLAEPKPGTLALISPTARPPVTNGRKRSKAKPNRPRAVPSQSFFTWHAANPPTQAALPL